MQTLQKVILCLTLCFLNYSCGQTSKNSEPLQASNTIQHNGKTYKLKEGIALPKPQSNQKAEKNIVFHKVKDPERNITAAYLPLPSNWVVKDKADSEGAIIFGLNNTRVFLTRNNNFVFSQIPGFNQMMAEQGHQIKPLKSVEQLVKEELIPVFQNDGINLIKQYRVPQLKAYDENYEQFVFKPVPMQKTFDVLATEWGDKKGNRLLFIIRQHTAYTQEGCYWGYFVNMMDASESHFEEAKTNYFYALENTKYNPKWLQTRYMEDAQEAARNNKLSQQRLAALRAEGQAIIKRGNAHSAMVDRNHKRFMDAHLERQTVSTGDTNYQVEAGSKVYWFNSNGEYIPTENVLFDPNLDPNLNNETWTKGTINN